MKAAQTPAASFTYQLTYDVAGRVTSVEVDAENTAVYEYRDNGQLARVDIQGSGIIDPGGPIAVYEDAENGDTAGWDIYDDTPAGAVFTNLYDNQRQSRVIDIQGDPNNENGFRLRLDDLSNWADQARTVLQWSFLFDAPFTVYIPVETTSGFRFISYNSFSENSSTVTDGSGVIYLHFGVGTYRSNGQWQTLVRDLQQDLEVFEPGNQIIEVNAFQIRGNGRLDDIMLMTARTDFANSVLSLNLTGPGQVTASPAGISCPGTCSMSLTHGTEVVLTASPDNGAALAGWTGCDSTDGDSCRVALVADRNVSVSFSAQTQRRLTVSVVGNGSVNSMPSGIDCGVSCAADFSDGTQVDLQANPDNGYQLKAWSGACSGNGACSLDMTEDKQVSAEFELIPASGGDRDQDGIPDDVDPSPDQANTNECDAANAVITNRTYNSGERISCQAASSINASQSLLSSGSEVVYMSPLVTLGNGFSVSYMSVFSVISQAPTATPAATSAKIASDRQITPSIVAGSIYQPMSEIPSSSNAGYLPPGLVAILLQRQAQLLGADLDADRARVLFATETGLLPEDDNGLSDIYLYDAETEALSLASVSSSGQIADGPSGSPRIHWDGASGVFVSEAGHLVEDDTNQVADVFIRYFESGITRRVSQAPEGWETEHPAGHPAIDGIGPEVLFDRSNEKDLLRIYATDYADLTPSVQELSDLAQAQTNWHRHHPSMGADGRFVAFLETASATDWSECRLVVVDRWYEVRRSLDCPVVAVEGLAVPRLGSDGRWVEWVDSRPEGDPLPIADVIVKQPNPLFSEED